MSIQSELLYEGIKMLMGSLEYFPKFVVWGFSFFCKEPDTKNWSFILNHAFSSSKQQQQECSIRVCQKNSDRYTFKPVFLCPQTSFWHTHSFFYAAVRRTQSVQHMKIQFFVFSFRCMKGKTEFRIREINIIPANAIFRHAKKCVWLCSYQIWIKSEIEKI